MSDVLNKISDVFRNYINYDTVNNFSDNKLRNARIPLVDFISFRFLYTDKNATYESITSKLNDTNFTRQAYVEKEKNIPIEIYEHLLNKIIEFANNSLNPKQQYIDNNEDPDYQLLGVDKDNIIFTDEVHFVLDNINNYGWNYKNKEVTFIKNIPTK